MGEIDHPSVLDAKVDYDRRAAKPRMRLGGGVRICEPPEPGNIRRQLEDTPIVDVVDHPVPNLCAPYISDGKAEIEAPGKARARAMRRREA